MQIQSRFYFIATILATLAFGAVGTSQTVPANPNQTPAGFSPVFAGKFFQNPKTGSHLSANTISIDADSGTPTRGQTFTLHLPSDAVIGSLKVILNGHDISDRFRGTSSILSAQDGLSTVKNVLAATVKLSSGGMASGRWRSMSAPVNKNNKSANGIPLAMARATGATLSPRGVTNPVAPPVCDPVAMCPSWLPPSVRFDTLSKGNWTGTTAWVQVNGVPYGLRGETISAQYVLLVLNRQTLAAEDFEWFSSGAGAAVTGYIANAKYTSQDLVIIGTGSGSNGVDNGLDTSSIGGTNFNNIPGNVPFPKSYMIVGSGGQASGTAYESIQPLGSTQPANAFATGSLQEDANGNYNFQSSDIVEYAIEPQDPANFANPTIRMNVPANLQVNGETQVEFLADAFAGQNGLWMLVLDRATLMPPFNVNNTSACYDFAPGAPTRVMANCGAFYAVGGGNSNIDGEWQALAIALSTVTSDQIVLLQSIGTVGSTSLAQTVESGSGVNSGFLQFAQAFEKLGGTPYAIAGPTYTNQDNYAFVGYLGAGNALTGGATELSTAFPGQIGVLHGTLQKNSNGAYRPAQTSPEQQGLFNAKGGLGDSDFLLSIASYQQPVEWPSNSATVLLPGATTIAGQQAAFRFISHWLLAGYYMKTIQGPHQDDIHFFFSGSTNTSINYQTMDPANLPSPGVGTWSTYGCTSFDGSTCTFQAIGDSAPSTFTVSDFNAVKTQMSLEVICLTNSLQYLVTGSTNLKDVVASGNANVSLALSAAANSIEGSGMGNLDAQTLASKNVTFSWQALVSTIGGIAEAAANLASGGELTPLWETLNPALQSTLKQAAAGANAVGGIMSAVGSAASIRTTTDTLSTSPQPFAPLTITVGELASQNLQSPVMAGFDTAVDNLTSDWGRLSLIGPRVVNVNDPTFFAPNQVQQVNTINALTTSSAQTFYSSLVPTVYNLHYWSGVQWTQPVAGVFQPTVGGGKGAYDQDLKCYAFYLNPSTNGGTSNPLGTLSLYQGITLPTMGGGNHPFSEDLGNYDFWVVDSTVSQAGSTATTIATMNSDLAESLFSSTALNIPMFQFFSSNGPMASVTKDASQDNISGFSADNICDASAYGPQVSSGAPSPVGSPSPGGPVVTTTTLISPTSGVLGHDIVLTAQVMTANQAVASGKVYILVDGTVVGSPALGSDGTASLTISGGLALGTHKVEANSAPGSGYSPSSAQASTFTVYSESADIAISMANTPVNVSYTSSSSPVAVQIGSIAGLAGNVVLSCTGLPVGLACSFNAQSTMLAANGSVNATVQIGPSPTAQAAATISIARKISLAVLLLPLFGLGGLRRGRSAVRLTVLLIIAAGVSAVAITGCSGGSSNPAPVRETGKKTITINASVGSVSRSIGMNINIQ
ncbi:MULTISPECIES: Ig-like domain-containing protein [Acidobacteriaceae]|uniref:Ig-like domain-containing protein n=1 Tax=Acidobacteriaceae TaxID=204434 RepID=UPI00131B1473|nr:MULTISPECIES: Ig-like domain-containing protein [Acidobacteriaceae]MDW5266817.1 Ig-like domain-containing protein [Edaphobacter sp.]